VISPRTSPRYSQFEAGHATRARFRLPGVLVLGGSPGGHDPVLPRRGRPSVAVTGRCLPSICSPGRLFRALSSEPPASAFGGCPRDSPGNDLNLRPEGELVALPGSGEEREVRAARNQSLFREINERLKETNDALRR
jgi:hypothetical protein